MTEKIIRGYTKWGRDCWKNMLDYFIYIVSFLITVPLVATLLVYFAAANVHNNKLKAIHTSVNWTTILYIIAVSLILHNLLGRSFIGWMVVFFIGALSVIIIIQWKSRTEVEFGKALRIVWRFSFLLFLMLYLVLFLVGVLKHVLA